MNLYGGDIDVTPRAQDRPAPLSSDEQALLRSLARVIYALPKAIEADLEREQQMSLSEYMTLMHLSEAPDRAMRMSELAEVASLSLSGMTHIVTRLQAQGLVQRLRCERDGRGWNAVLTDAGLARLTEAWPTNVTSVRRHLLEHLGDIDIGPLAKAFGNVAT
ncbi:MAG TPA: MarR family transcriptional regulator [Pseudonocardiaceae bacterium]|jgi:DNA-binding MarR family transcriptional regulator|nr:MarR family transcriptional regulator [Pseudonocardiaceae bacterium]